MRTYNYDPSGRLISVATLGAADLNQMFAHAQEQAAALRKRRDEGEIIDTALLDAYEAEPEYLLPAHCTAVVPPSIPENHYARWNGTAWEITPEPVPEPEIEAEAEAASTAENAEHTPAPVDPAADRLQAAEERLEEHMQAMARGAGYKSLERVIGYAEEPAVPRYQEEGKKFRRWQSLIWEWFYTEAIQARVQDETFHLIDLNTEPPRVNPDPA